MQLTRPKLACVLLTAALLGCDGLFAGPQPPIQACQADSDCPGSEVCFVDGCGDPGKDIAVEVTPSALSGAYPEDFDVEDLKATQTLQLFPPSDLHGHVTQDQASGGELPYTGVISMVVNGQSELIPGLSRHFEATVQPDTDGSYSVPVGSGTFSVQATAADPTLPPLLNTDETVEPGQSPTLDLRLPSPTALLSLTSALVGLPLNAAMNVQAFDLQGHPLSQRVPVDSAGSFTVVVLGDAVSQGEFSLVATPVDPAALLPEQTFTLLGAALPGTLDLGAFGDPVAVTGKLLDGSGAAVVGATVHLEGPVTGGGYFRGQAVQTDGTGAFSLESLANAPGGQLSLVAVPAPGSPAGMLVQGVTASGASTDLGAVTCPARIQVVGDLALPDGSPASGVKVQAQPLAPPDGGTLLPPANVETTSGSDARFSLWLDPAQYRLDFLPAGKLPRVSRFVDVETTLATGGTIDLGQVTLSHGRSVNGHVEILNPEGGDPTPAPLARVRFFRKVQVGAMTSSVLLDQTYADQNGDYTVLLPTR